MATTESKSNAAPSEHLNFSFPSDSILQMQKIKITQSAETEYFAVHNFAGGYVGLQQLRNEEKVPNILISSLWDVDTAKGIFSQASYVGPDTKVSRFGGEGDGTKCINAYDWKLNTWYNLVLRSWKANGNLYIATFVQNLATSNWKHISTLYIPVRNTFLGSGDDSFLENWDGYDPATDGHLKRKASFKDCWSLNVAGIWEKHTSRIFSANSGDEIRNGIYNLAFNAGYDTTENSYFMEHGGDTKPSAMFNGGRTLHLPAQNDQGTAPFLSVGEITNVTACYYPGEVNVSWVINQQKSPQFSSKIKILNATGTIINTIFQILPEQRTAQIKQIIAPGTYQAQVAIMDIFNQSSSAYKTNFVVTTFYKIKNVHSGKYLSIAENSLNNSAKIVQMTSNDSYSQQWKITALTIGYNLTNRNSGKNIDISGSNETNGLPLIQYDPNYNTNQLWNISAVGNGVFYIQSKLPKGLVIDDAGGSQADGAIIIIYQLNGDKGSENQQWKFEPVH